jgi:hypothetical protein
MALETTTGVEQANTSGSDEGQINGVLIEQVRPQITSRPPAHPL